MDIVEKLRSQIGDDVQHMFDHEALFRIAADEIERLRADLREAGMQALASMGQATDAYEAQLKAEAEVDELKRENKWLRGNCDADPDGVHSVISEGRYKFCAKCGETITPDKLRMAEVCAERDAAKAEVERLRAALEQIGGERGRFGFPFPESDPDYGSFAVMLARETLRDHATASGGKSGGSDAA